MTLGELCVAFTAPTAGAALQAKRLIHEAACKHGLDGPPSLFFLSVGNNTDNTGAKDTSERRISEAFYTPQPNPGSVRVCVMEWEHGCVCIWGSEGGNRGPLCDGQGGPGARASGLHAKTSAV